MEAIKTINRFEWRQKLWRGKPPNGAVVWWAGGVSLFMALPLLYVAVKALGADGAIWRTLGKSYLPMLIGNTLSLVGMATLLALGLGVSLGWLVERTDLPGRGFWRWSLALPLAIPPYVGAFAYITLIGPGGMVAKGLGHWLGIPHYEVKLPSIFSFGGVWLVITAFTFPYVYLMVMAGLRRMNANLEEAAAMAGYGPWRIFGRVTLPLLRPSMAAGGLLVALYALSDFGTVGMLRFSTFTYAIYGQLVTRFDRGGAAVLSLALIAITVLVLWLEWRSRANQRYHQTVGTCRQPRPLALGPWRWPMFAYAVTVFLLAVALPLGVVSYWCVEGIGEGALKADFWSYLWNTLSTSALAATATLLLALPLAYLHSRHPGPASDWMSRAAYGGYALPGVVVALGMIFFSTAYFPVFYGTVGLLVLTYIVRFLPQAMQAQEAALAQISPNLDEAAQTMGYGGTETLLRVLLPLIRPGALAGWALVFVSCVKELPATMMLRPLGFETLAFRVWVEAGEGHYEMAAPAAMLLVLIGMALLPILLRRGTDQ